MKDTKPILQALSYLTQLGMSVAMPPVLCILGGIWLQNKFALGDWIVVAALLTGLVSGACSFASFIRLARYRASKKEDTDDETGERR